jgi:hypothetical protein
VHAAPQIRALTGLRALPALLVVFYHFYREHIPAVPVVPYVVDSGFVAVGMFFVLSGFILTYSYAGVSLRDPSERRRFFRARFARVYPVYLLSLVVGFLARLPASATEAATWRGLRHIALTRPPRSARRRPSVCPWHTHLRAPGRARRGGRGAAWTGSDRSVLPVTAERWRNGSREACRLRRLRTRLMLEGGLDGLPADQPMLDWSAPALR